MEQKQSAPNSTAVLVLGILSLVLWCCYGIGLILGIIALVLASSGLKEYNANPEMYTSIGNLKAGRVCAIIGVSLGAIYVIWWVFYFVILGHTMVGMQEMLQQIQDAQEMQQY